jgi:hypothetical protein
MVDNSWINLPDDTLGPAHSKFLAALKQLNTLGYPDSGSYAVDPDFCIALGIPIDPVIAQNAGNNSTNYMEERALAWACLLHYQVLDLLLGALLPRKSSPAVPDTVSVWGQSTIKVP